MFLYKYLLYIYELISVYIIPSIYKKISSFLYMHSFKKKKFVIYLQIYIIKEMFYCS